MSTAFYRYGRWNFAHVLGILFTRTDWPAFFVCVFVSSPKRFCLRWSKICQNENAKKGKIKENIFNTTPLDAIRPRDVWYKPFAKFYGLTRKNGVDFGRAKKQTPFNLGPACIYFICVISDNHAQGIYIGRPHAHVFFFTGIPFVLHKNNTLKPYHVLHACIHMFLSAVVVVAAAIISCGKASRGTCPCWRRSRRHGPSTWECSPSCSRRGPWSEPFSRPRSSLVRYVHKNIFQYY